MSHKLIVVAAPSGAGKTTIVKHLLAKFGFLAFSVSAATREKRAHEVEGKDYYFMSVEMFKSKIANHEFVEWEEVYKDQFYGTLKSEVERIWSLGKHVVFDIDVNGALSIKKHLPEETLLIFIKPPSPEILFERLRGRKTETEESLKRRIDKAALELTYEDKFDVVIVNDDLDKAFKEAENIVKAFAEEE
jgi:guanylate kinase